MEGNHKSCCEIKARQCGRMNEEEEEILKRKISCHPLYGLLVKAHFDCIKVGLDDMDETDRSSYMIDEKQADKEESSLSMTNQSELDQFMEAYCMALQQLKEAMEEPQQETMTFINTMHSQLEELTGTHTVPAPAELKQPPFLLLPKEEETNGCELEQRSSLEIQIL